MCYIKKTISVKILVICVINSSRLRKCFVRGHIRRVVCVKSPHSLLSRSFGFWHTQALEYNPVQSTFYDVNYIFDKKTTEDDSGSEGKFWRRNRQRARKMRRGSNFHQSICELQTNAVDSKLSFSLEYDLIFLLQITRIGARRISCSTGVVAFKKINVVLVVYSSWHY